MRETAALAVSFFVFCVFSMAQKPSFEVASVKPVAPGRAGDGLPRGGPGTSDPETFSIQAIGLRGLITWAWSVRTFQVSGPAWIDSARYDIAAKVRPGATKDQFRMMLRSLLEERFNLKFHQESKTHAAYDLVVDKRGFKLKPSTKEQVIPEENKEQMALMGMKSYFGIVPRPGGRLIVGTALPIAAFANVLEGQFDNVPVLDKTGITGTWDFYVEFANVDDTTGASSLPSLFTAVEEKCGLKLLPVKAPFDIMVIDHIDPPDEN